MNEEKDRSTTLSKVAEIVKTCPKFFDFDWCNINCDLFHFCDQIYESQDVTKINHGTISLTDEFIKETIKQIKKRLGMESGEL